MSGRPSIEESSADIELLLVEDDPAHRALVRQALRRHFAGVHVHCAASIAEGRALLSRHRVDLVLSDLLLPDGRGVEFLAGSEQEYPVLIMTSHGDETVAVDVLKAGAQDYIVKSGDSLGKIALRCERGLLGWRNVVERRRAEAALRESELRFRALVENAPEAIVVLDPDSGRFVDANENALRLFGLERAAILGHGPASLSPASQPDGQDSARMAREKVRAAVTGATPVFEWTHIGAGGEPLPCEIRLARLPVGGRYLVRGSITDIRERKRIEQQLQQHSAQLQALSQRLFEVQEAERAHVAYELQEQIGQSLTALKLRLRHGQETGNGDAVSDALSDSMQIIDTVLEHIRDLSLSLRPSMLDDLGLATALRWYLNSQSRRTGTEVSLVDKLRDPQRLSAEVETACFRIAQEAVNDAVRHAAARHVCISLSRQEGQLLLKIEDDRAIPGAGAEPVQGAVRPGLSHVVMRERAGLAGGRLSIESLAPRGQRVRVVFPVPKAPGEIPE